MEDIPKRQPKITIVTPSYNQGEFLETTILSVLDQNYPNLEYIIIDGGSTDNSVEIIKKYSSRLHYWESNKDKGQSDAINKGLSKATGDIATWLNSDDYYLPGTLHKVAEIWNKEPFHFLVGNCLFVDEHGTLTVDQRKSRLIENSRYLPCTNQCIINQPASFFSMKVFREVGPLDLDLHYSMDVDFWLKIAAGNHHFTYTDDYFTNFRRHHKTKSSIGNLHFIKDTLESDFLLSRLKKINFEYYYEVKKQCVDCLLYNLRIEHQTTELLKQGIMNISSSPNIVFQHWRKYLINKIKLFSGLK